MGPPTFKKLLYSFVSLTPYILVLMFTIFYIKNYSLLITFWFLLGIIILIIICYLGKFFLKLKGSREALRLDLIEKFGNMVIDKERSCNVIESPFLKNIAVPAIDISLIVFIWVYIFIMYFITDMEYGKEKEKMKLFNNYRKIVQRKEELTEDGYDNKGEENEKLDKDLDNRAKNKFFLNIILSIIVGIVVIQYVVIFVFNKKCLGAGQIIVSVIVGAGWAVGWKLLSNQTFLLESSGVGYMDNDGKGGLKFKPPNNLHTFDKSLNWNSVIEDIIRKNNRRCSWDIFGTKYTCLK